MLVCAYVHGERLVVAVSEAVERQLELACIGSGRI